MRDAHGVQEALGPSIDCTLAVDIGADADGGHRCAGPRDREDRAQRAAQVTFFSFSATLEPRVK